MKYNHPKFETVVAFLKAKGWAFAKKDKAAVYLDPPDYITFEEPFQFEIPSNTKLKEHQRWLTYSIHSVAEMYDFKYQVLYDLSCYDFKDVKNILQPRREPLAVAA